MSQPRVDLFRPIHKGVRALLFSTAGRPARADFGRDAEARDVLSQVGCLLARLAQHAHYEDMLVFPVLAAHDRTLAQSLAFDHAAIDRAQFELGALVARADGADPAARLDLVPWILSALNRLVAAHLEHMDREEREANEVLWRSCSDADLLAIRARISASIDPVEGLKWLEVLLPALNAPERNAFVAGVVPNVPPAVAAQIARIAAAA